VTKNSIKSNDFKVVLRRTFTGESGFKILINSRGQPLLVKEMSSMKIDPELSSV